MSATRALLAFIIRYAHNKTMSKYFDKGFFRFLLGFVAIVAFSMVVIVALRLYQEQSSIQKASVIESEN